MSRMRIFFSVFTMGGEVSKVPSKQEDLYANCRENESWSQVAVVPVDQWKFICNPAFGIDYYNAWQNRQLRVMKRPWSSFVMHGKNSISGKDEKICSFTCRVTETGREEKLKGWLKDASVLTIHPRIAVIQLVLPRAVKLLVIDYHSDNLLGTYTFAFTKEPCVQECHLSPDASIMLCRQNFWLRRKLNHLTSFDPNIRVIQIKDGLCTRLFVIEDTMQQYSVFASGLSMDPRYPSGRVMLFASTLQLVHTHPQEAVDNIHSYDLAQCQLDMSASDYSLDHVVHHAQHSPDGEMVAVILVDVTIYLSCTLHAQELRIYNSDSMLPMHSMPLFRHMTKPHLLRTFPMFSRDMAFIAQVSGSSVYVSKLPQQCNSLQDWCRLVIRQNTVLAQVYALPIPKKLQAFLDFKPPQSQ